MVHFIITGRCSDNPYISASIDISSDFKYPSVLERQDSYEYYASTYFYCSIPSVIDYKWEVALLEKVSFNLLEVFANIFCFCVLLLLLFVLKSHCQSLLIFIVVSTCCCSCFCYSYSNLVFSLGNPAMSILTIPIMP